ncbi:MAG: hypothetical protein ACOX5R_05040 [bacterium]|jgi:protein-tyrosine kinase
MIPLYERLEELQVIQALPVEQAQPKVVQPVLSKEIEKKFFNLYQRIDTELSTVEHRVIEFISSMKGEGSSSLIKEFGMFLADQLNLSVLLFDAHRIRPQLGKRLSIHCSSGWDEVIVRQKPTWSAITQVGKRPLYITQASSAASHEFAFIRSELVIDFIRNVKPAFHVILVDSAPIWNGEEAIDISPIIDGSILLVEAGKTKSVLVKKSINYLKSNRTNVLGAVLNKREYPIPNWLYNRL